MVATRNTKAMAIAALAALALAACGKGDKPKTA